MQHPQPRVDRRTGALNSGPRAELVAAVDTTRVRESDGTWGDRQARRVGWLQIRMGNEMGCAGDQ